MKLKTEIKPQKSKNTIDYYSRLLLVGSCFSDTIANKLKSHRFDVISNPFGISYNPSSIFYQLTRAIDQQLFVKEEFFLDDDLWHHYELHSSWSSTDLIQLTNSANDQLAHLHQQLKQSTHLIITLGTAFVYELKSSHTLVSNCHKQEAALFEKRLVSPDEILKSMEQFFQKVTEFNPTLQLIFTLSPVRHIKDGIIENNRSKAHLRCALFEFLEQHDTCEYFPSYELLLDELRDYRFYDRDLVHPNELAIELIWEHFVKTYMNESCLADMKLAQTIHKSSTHQPFQPQSHQHQLFLKKLNERITTFYTKYPHLKVS